ncbi:DNRLRE domain-containing protein [Streptomyces sp. NPDC007861]|uniref:DNRLRE domain-containing protein n=1 Tax=Streptomyces sp. NPDC007861 TaxID=3154893 RepID=UPI0033E83A08
MTKAVSAKDSKGQEIAGSPTPFMWDSAGKPAVTEGTDPQPAEPSAPPAPSYSEDPDEPLPTSPGGYPDFPASPAPPESPAPTDSLTSTPAQQSAHRANARPEGGAVVNAGYRAANTASPTSEEVFALPHLSGPQPGTHRAVGKASMTGQGSASAVLTITPDRALLDSASTVWPAFIDPSVYGKTKNWTTVYAKHPDSSFYDGANYNTGTTEARVGYESTTGGLSRSFFRLGWSTAFKGATVSSATIQLLETYSWSCEAREMQLWHTGNISSGTTWNKQPSWQTELGRKSFAHGYNSSCPDAYVTYDGKAIAQDAADAGWISFTIGLRSTNESSSASWKKFKAEGASAPRIDIVYNRKPAEPTQLHMTPGPDCDTTAPYAAVGKSDLVFDAKSSDPDGDLKYLDFEVWQSGSTTKIFVGNRTVDSTGKASVNVPLSNFVNGKTYFWRVRAIDSTGAASGYGPPGAVDCGFVYDATRPNSPDVTSPTFPEDDGTGSIWSKVPFGTTGTGTFSANGSNDTVRYEYSYNNTSYNHSATPSAAGGSVTVTLDPPLRGPNVLYVRSVDGSGNASEAYKYLFYLSPSQSGDTPGDVTGDAHPDLFVIDQFGDLRLYPAAGNGTIHASIPAAHNGGKVLAEDDAYDTYWADALITHNGDWARGDGIQDLIARRTEERPGGQPSVKKLYVYPGDGYGSVDIRDRQEILMPSGAPDPAGFDQILAINDIDNDGRPDMFATAGTQLWALLGYTGSAFSKAVLLNDSSAQTDRDIVLVGDMNGDGEMDMVYRTIPSGRLIIRYGKPDANGGTSLTSLATSGDSLNGADAEYSASGWTTSDVHLVFGGPDANTDGIPDMYAVMKDQFGSVRYYRGGASAIGAYTTVVTNGWNQKKALG